MLVLVCGDKGWRNVERIKQRLEELPEGTRIIHGADGTRITHTDESGVSRTESCGADFIADTVAKELGFRTLGFPPNWGVHGVSAVLVRNLRMLKENPDLVLVFHNDVKKSKGVAHLVNHVKNKGINMEVWGEDEVVYS